MAPRLNRPRAWRVQLEHSRSDALEARPAAGYAPSDQSTMPIGGFWYRTESGDPAPKDHSARCNHAFEEAFP